MEPIPPAQVNANAALPPPDLTSPSALTTWVVAGFVRHLVGIIAGALVSRGFFASSDAEMLVGVLFALAMLGWSAFEKFAKANAHDVAVNLAESNGFQSAIKRVAAAVDVKAARQLPISEHPGYEAIKEKFGADASGNFSPESQLSDVTSFIKPPGTAAGVGPQSGFALTEAIGVLAALAFLVLAILTFSGCATNTGDAAKDRRGRVTNAILSIIGRDVTNEVVYSVANLGSQAAQGNKIDFAWAAQTALYQQGPTLLTSTDVQNVIAAATANQLPGVAQVAAQSFAAANPQTPAERVAVANTIAKSIADGAVKATDVKDGKAIVPPQASRSRVHPEPYVWPQPLHFRATRPELRTLYSEDEQPIVPAIRADGALIVTRTND